MIVRMKKNIKFLKESKEGIEDNFQNESMECCAPNILNESKDSEKVNFQNESMECCVPNILNESKDNDKVNFQNESMEFCVPEILNESKDKNKDSFLNESKEDKQPDEVSNRVINDITRKSERLKNKPHISYYEDKTSSNNYTLNADTKFLTKLLIHSKKLIAEMIKIYGKKLLK